ncbi:MAG: hypothetical protein ACLSHC_15410 [Bilophila wadsworthia]
MRMFNADGPEAEMRQRRAAWAIRHDNGHTDKEQVRIETLAGAGRSGSCSGEKWRR